MLIGTSDSHIPTIENYSPDLTAPDTVAKYWLRLISDPLGQAICIPLIVARGAHDGPVLGVTAAVHGNELNGISVIQRLFSDIDTSDLHGTLIGVPVVNVPAYIRKKRRFNDGTDLNHIMPGKENGNISQLYAHRFFHRLVIHFDSLVDLHTASTGRINSYYIRADMSQPSTRDLANVQNADIIVHNPPSDGTLRGAAAEINIPAITIEVGNPNLFQKRVIKSGVEGIHNTLCHLGMIEEEPIENQRDTVLCESSQWIYTHKGGLLSVKTDILDQLSAGESIATLRDIFGETIHEYCTDEAGIVIGRSVNPVTQSGGRIIHLGKISTNHQIIRP